MNMVFDLVGQSSRSFVFNISTRDPATLTGARVQINYPNVQRLFRIEK